jgi:hypothetical protein
MGMIELHVDHCREHPFYGICRRTGGELDHGSPKGFRDVRRRRLLTHTGVGLWAMVHLVVSNSGPHQLPDIGRSFGRSDASRIDTSIRGDVVDLTARDTNVYKLAVR